MVVMRMKEKLLNYAKKGYKPYLMKSFTER